MGGVSWLVGRGNPLWADLRSTVLGGHRRYVVPGHITLTLPTAARLGPSLSHFVGEGFLGSLPGMLLVCIMRTMRSGELIRELRAAGWVLDRVRGSHHVFKHPVHPGHVVVPHPKKQLGPGLIAAIRKQAQIRRT